MSTAVAVVMAVKCTDADDKGADDKAVERVETSGADRLGTSSISWPNVVSSSFSRSQTSIVPVLLVAVVAAVNVEVVAVAWEVAVAVTEGELLEVA